MQLSKDQKNILKGGIAGWVGMIVALLLFAAFGTASWRQTLWLVLGLTVGEIIVGLFLIFGARIPKEKNDNQ